MQCGLMPSTPNHEKQFQFHSTRKKSKSSITRMSKEEVEHQREKLGRETSVFCGICLKLVYTKCFLWVHTACTATISTPELEVIDDYLCDYCSP